MSLAGCGDTAQSDGAEDSKDDPDKGWLEADLDADESMQRLREAQAAREAMPGRAVYEAACASCHAEGVARAPHTSMIGMMTPEAVLRAISGETS